MELLDSLKHTPSRLHLVLFLGKRLLEQVSDTGLIVYNKDLVGQTTSLYAIRSGGILPPGITTPDRVPAWGTTTWTRDTLTEAE